MQFYPSSVYEHEPQIKYGTKLPALRLVTARSITQLPNTRPSSPGGRHTQLQAQFWEGTGTSMHFSWPFHEDVRSTNPFTRIQHSVKTLKWRKNIGSDLPHMFSCFVLLFCHTTFTLTKDVSYRREGQKPYTDRVFIWIQKYYTHLVYGRDVLSSSSSAVFLCLPLLSITHSFLFSTAKLTSWDNICRDLCQWTSKLLALIWSFV
jgi:hypothetical protein